MNCIRTNALTVVACTLIAAGCGGDSTPTVGPTPVVSANVGGMWTGFASLTTVDGGGCVGMGLAAGIGGDGPPLEAVIDQNDTSLMIVVTNGVSHERCTYSGTILGDSLTASLSSCIPQVLPLGSACALAGDPREWEKETLSVQFSGTVDGDSLTGAVFETARVMSGEESHEVTINANLTLTR